MISNHVTDCTQERSLGVRAIGLYVFPAGRSYYPALVKNTFAHGSDQFLKLQNVKQLKMIISV